MVERDPPVRRLALLRWLVDEKRWLCVFEARDVYSVRRRLAARGAEISEPTRIISFVGRRGDVEAAVAAVPEPGVEPGDLQLKLLFPEA